MAITNKRRVFVEEYLRDLNATQAAIRAGYAKRSARQQGQRLLTKDDISDAIKARLDERAMKADEVIQRLTDMARGDIGDFMDIERMTFSLNLAKAKEKGLTHLIHKIKDRVVMTSNKDGEETETHTIEIELYDAHAALVDFGRYHKLFTDNMDITSKGEQIYDPTGLLSRLLPEFAPRDETGTAKETKQDRTLPTAI